MGKREIITINIIARALNFNTKKLKNDDGNRWKDNHSA